VNAFEGEAVAAIFIKPLNHAIRDGNPIQAIIRATSAYDDHSHQNDVNSRLNTHESTIREAYSAAGLKPSDTVYIEVSFYHINSVPLVVHESGRVADRCSVHLVPTLLLIRRSKLSLAQTTKMSVLLKEYLKTIRA
jgi:3-oxoacyl-(acyl-carrier-protein) synthase